MLFLLLPLSYAIPTQKSPSVALGVLCVPCLPAGRSVFVLS